MLLPATTSILVLCNSIIATSSTNQFHPREYPKRIALCAAVNRTPGPEHQAVNLTLHYVDIYPEASTTLLMVHGWPSLWSTWSRQIQEFKSDYHLVIPDLRGFGESAHPGDTRSSGTMVDMVGDLACILTHAQVHSAICIGHDWGSQLCYEAARMRPDIITAVVGAVVPYIPAAGPLVPIQDLVFAFPKLAYQIYFDERTDTAIAELNRDIRRSVRATLRTVESPPPDQFLRSSQSYLDAYNQIEEIPPVPFFTSEEEDYFVEQYSIQGFKHTLQFYMHENRYASWYLAHTQGNATIPQPVLAIFPNEDPVADWAVASRLLKSDEFIPHETKEVINGAHWVHLENSNKFNSILRRWLQGLEGKSRSAAEFRPADEL